MSFSFCLFLFLFFSLSLFHCTRDDALGETVARPYGDLGVRFYNRPCPVWPAAATATTTIWPGDSVPTTTVPPGASITVSTATPAATTTAATTEFQAVYVKMKLHIF